MNVYTANYDATKPTPRAITVPLNSNFGIGVGVCYDSKPVEITKDSLKLNDKSADDVLGNMAIFNMESDGNEGRESYNVEVEAPGLPSKELVFNKTITLDAGRGTIRESIADWEGAELVIPDTTPKPNYDYSKNPFQAVVKIPGGGERWGFQTYFVDENNNSLAMINNISEGFVDEAQIFWVFDGHGGHVATDRWTVPANCYVYINIYTASVYTTAEVNYAYTETFTGNFKLYIDKKDNGIAEGYAENAEFKDTMTISGTYADDTEFSYTVPTVEE